MRVVVARSWAAQRVARVAVALYLAAAVAVSTARGGSVLDERACHQPGHTSYPFCDTSKTIAERVADLISRVKDEDKPALLTARGWPQGATKSLAYLGVPPHDWVSDADPLSWLKKNPRCASWSS